MSLVDYHELGASTNEVVATVLALDVVERHDRVREDIEYRPVSANTVQSTSRVGQDQFGFDVKLLSHFFLPLFSQMRRAMNSHPLHFGTIEQFPSDQESFDRLPDTDVVGDQKPNRIELQGHQ